MSFLASLPHTSILLVTHAPLASALKACVVHAQPEYESYVRVYDVDAKASWDEALDLGFKVVDQIDAPQILMMTDIIGATPYNIGRCMLDTFPKSREHQSIQLVSGVNLPMVFRALTYHQRPLDELIQLVIAGGVTSIKEIHCTPCVDLKGMV